MAQFALPLCLAFILIAFRQDAKECRQISRSSWIPSIWLAVAASKSFSLWIHPSQALVNVAEYDYIQGSPTDRAFLIILLCAGFMVLYKRKNRFSFYLRDNAYLFLFYFYAFLSIGWSDYQGTSIKRWIRVAGDIIMVLIILTEDDQKEAIDHVLRRCAILLMPLSAVFIRFYGNIGIGYDRDGVRTWTGVSTSKNSLGMLCAFMAVYLIWRLLKKWPKFVLLDAILLLLTLYLLRGSRSATSVIVFIIGVMLLVAAALLKGDVRKLKKMVVITVLSLLILQGLFISVFNKSLESLLFSATDRNSSLTGRVPLWLKLIQIGSQRAILGSGYGSVWIADSSRMEDIFYGPQANPHNGYIHVFLDLGLVGLALLFILIFHAYKKVINSFEETGEIAILLLVFIIMILLHNITESTLMRGTNLLWFLFLLSSIIVIKKTDSPATHS